MGLFGVSKILVLIVIIAAVWYGFKFFTRRNQIGGQRKQTEFDSGSKKTTNQPAQDMESCSICGTFVPNASAKNCGRDSCPYPD